VLVLSGLGMLRVLSGFFASGDEVAQ
jgi:hypothetical protein